jgi:hypothetical protein
MLIFLCKDVYNLGTFNLQKCLQLKDRTLSVTTNMFMFSLLPSVLLLGDSSNSVFDRQHVSASQTDADRLLQSYEFFSNGFTFTTLSSFLTALLSLVILHTTALLQVLIYLLIAALLGAMLY